ncbi:ammonium transporter [Weissella diestrammenae]|uniref:Ammonium transporter n=1 Tax=Weissella diestrammenae TaxID=1162633 RepID=A0A7G9T5T1_9LACO|nr:ammonium transporter [Weissella diestrammenae]MCM0582285.1 ammonium transporter [Weissella diestrammenae]QNN75456.1 ammonium transporter [Weissella diestrammenae]
MTAGNIAWVLMATALVWLMVPGLALFYGGFTHPKHMVNTFAMVLIAIAIGGVLWFVVGYSLAFSGNQAIIGDFHDAFLHGVSMVDSTKGYTIPDGLFALFQGMFPMITMAIIAGGVVGRMNFKAFIVFLILWLFLVYVPLAHMVWGNGWFARLGVLDFAGGTVVHISSGVSSLVLALCLGRRQEMTSTVAHNMPAIVIGGGLLWFGWFGFNAGSALAANGQAILAFINTSVAASMGMVTWLIISLVLAQHIKVTDLLSGALAGLVAITPGAGYVNPGSAAVIGLIVAFVVWLSITYVKNHLGYDDTLDAFGIHGIGGIFGGLLTGVFAIKSLAGHAGLIEGQGHLFLVQTLSISVTLLVVVSITFMIVKFIKHVMPLRVDQRVELAGIDVAQHGETIY